ncbi:MAG TPA: BrnT family toxin [Reyranella sp.]
MEFEWDEAKSEANYQLRGLDFGYATLVFRDPFRLDWPDDRREYGERRRQAIGAIEGLTYFVAYTRRRNRIRIISARRAELDEDRAYRQGTT